MLLLQILKKKKIEKQSLLSKNFILEKYIDRLTSKIAILNSVKDKEKIKRLRVLLKTELVKKNKLLKHSDRFKLISSNTNFTTNKVLSRKSGLNNLKQNLVVYIININLTNTNTLVNVTDIRGNTKISYSSGSVNLKGKQKVKQPAALINILKLLIVKAKFLKNKPIALHFKNTKTHYESFIVNMLKNKFFIKTIRSYNLQPHNGCRPKKLKRF